MAWNLTLQDASFRGVTFEVQTVEDRGEKALCVHEYPYRSGAEVEDLGRKPRVIPVTAIFWGVAYESRIKALVAAFEEAGPGELIHPVFGSLTVAVRRWQISHSAERHDYATVTFEAVEAVTDNPFFGATSSRSLAEQALADISSSLDEALGLSESELGKTLGQWADTAANIKARVETELQGVLDVLDAGRSVVRSVLSYVDVPAAFVADAQAIADLRKGWRLAVSQGRDELEAANRARLQAEAAAAAKAKAEEEEARKRQEIADEVDSVADMEAAVSGDLGAFRPDNAAKAFAARAARLKSDEAKAAAQVAAERIDALAKVQAWLIEAAKDGTLATFGVAGADAEGITLGGAKQSWEDFAIKQQAASFRIFNTLLADDRGSRALSTLRRAELAIGARQFILRYYGPSMLEKSKSLRDLMDRLKTVAEGLPATRAALGRLEPQESGE